MFQLQLQHQQQPHSRCGSITLLEYNKSIDPTLEQRIKDIEQHVQNHIQFRIQQRSLFLSRDLGLGLGLGANIVDPLITIPVVFHVVYAAPAENIADSVLNSQLTRLNADYQATNSDINKVPSVTAPVPFNNLPYFDTVLGNHNINFVLQTIIRKSTTTTNFGPTNTKIYYDSMGGSNAWPSTTYLNIWICNLGSSILGYSQFPGGPAATDGIVLDYRATGDPSIYTSYNMGRTATHEIGHWLNLHHIWGDASCGDDLVADTPPQLAANYGDPVHPKPSPPCNLTGDMFMNYMDYVDDDSMFMFTQGQVDRARALFAPGGPRNSFITGPVPTTTTTIAPTTLPPTTLPNMYTSSTTMVPSTTVPPTTAPPTTAPPTTAPPTTAPPTTVPPTTAPPTTPTIHPVTGNSFSAAKIATIVISVVLGIIGIILTIYGFVTSYITGGIIAMRVLGIIFCAISLILIIVASVNLL